MDVRPIDAHVAEIKLIETLASAMAKRKTVYDASDELIEAVRSKTPTLDYAPVVHGKWLWDGFDGIGWQCSLCGHGESREAVMPKANYCPECGAKMD